MEGIFNFEDAEDNMEMLGILCSEQITLFRLVWIFGAFQKRVVSPSGWGILRYYFLQGYEFLRDVPHNLEGVEFSFCSHTFL